MRPQPTRQNVAVYRGNSSARNSLLGEVYDYAAGLPAGSLDGAVRALEWIRGPVAGQDILATADSETFYVMRPDCVWEADTTRGNTAVMALLQQWAKSEITTMTTLEVELRSAHAAAEVDDDAAFLDRYESTRERFTAASRSWRGKLRSVGYRRSVLDELASLVRDGGADQFDANPDVLAVLNGIVDLRTGQERAIRPSDRVTQQVPVGYDPTAQAPLWAEFLAQSIVNEAGEPDEETVAWLRRLVGYGITGHTREQMFAVFYGSGANGKGVLIDTLDRLFRPMIRTLEMATLEGGSRRAGAASGDVARLQGARLVVASEGEQNARVSAATLKRWTGQDRITARPLFKGEFEFQPRFLLILLTNAHPSIVDTSEGFWRRVNLVPFRRYFDKATRDDRLRDRLAQELPGILRWAVDGAREWYAMGELGSTAAIDQETATYRASQDRLSEFVDWGLSVTGDHYDVATVTAVHKAYLEWAQDNGEERPLQRSTLAAKLAARRGIRQDTRNKQAVLRGVTVLDHTGRKQRQHAADRAERRLHAVE